MKTAAMILFSFITLSHAYYNCQENSRSQRVQDVTDDGLTSAFAASADAIHNTTCSGKDYMDCCNSDECHHCRKVFKGTLLKFYRIHSKYRKKTVRSEVRCEDGSYCIAKAAECRQVEDMQFDERDKSCDVYAQFQLSGIASILVFIAIGFACVGGVFYFIVYKRQEQKKEKALDDNKDVPNPTVTKFAGVVQNTSVPTHTTMNPPPGFAGATTNVLPGYAGATANVPSGYAEAATNVPPGFAGATTNLPPGFEGAAINLPPGFEAKWDPNTNQVYWVDHNAKQATWVDPRSIQNPGGNPDMV